MLDSRLHRPDPGYLWLGTAIVLATLVAGFWFVGFVTSIGKQLEEDRVLSLARTVTATLAFEPITALMGSPSDVGTAHLDSVREKLRRARDVNPDFRFVYLMRPSVDAPDKMIFIADAEARGSVDYSAPGDLYDGPSGALWQVWNSGIAMVQPVHADDWGRWITAIAPVRDDNGTMIAILGMDIRADAWLSTLARYRAFSLAIVALVLLLEVLFLLGLHLQKSSQRRLAALNDRLEQQLDALEAAQTGLRLADLVVQHTGEAIVVLDPDLRVISANPGFTKITGYAVKAIQGQVLPLFVEDDRDTLKQIHSHLAVDPHWDGTLWARRADGERFPLETSVDAVLNSKGQTHRHVMVFRDVTVQKRLEDRLRELSATDGLTLLANRRRFDEAMDLSWRDAVRDGKPVSLLMIDVDHFKSYNDLYGHPAGDLCLQQIASALAGAVQDKDALVARYGGEEFAVILPGIRADKANALAEVLRQTIESLGIPHRGNPDGGRVTVSIGTSTRQPPQTSGFEELLMHADRALYQAKEKGRNAVASETGHIS